MRKAIIAVLFLAVIMPVIFRHSVFAQQVLEATVSKEWTVETAREEAFRNVEKTKDLSAYSAVDPNLIENRIAINNKQEKVGNRVITDYSDGTYNIVFLEKNYFNKEFHYLKNGKLTDIEFYSKPVEANTLSQLYAEDNIASYTIKSYWYSYPDGKLSNVDLKINERNRYMFNPDGTLNCHWVNGKGYDAAGKQFATIKATIKK